MGRIAKRASVARIKANYTLKPEIYNAITSRAKKMKLSKTEFIEAAVENFLKTLDGNEEYLEEKENSKKILKIERILRKYKL